MLTISKLYYVNPQLWTYCVLSKRLLRSSVGCLQHGLTHYNFYRYDRARWRGTGSQSMLTFIPHSLLLNHIHYYYFTPINYEQTAIGGRKNLFITYRLFKSPLVGKLGGRRFRSYGDCYISFV